MLSNPTPSREALLLVATAGTLPMLVGALRTIGPDAPRVLGVVLADDGDAAALAAAGDVPVLGMIDDIPDLHRHMSPTACVVCIPSSMVIAGARVRATLDRLGLPARHLPEISDVLRGAAAPGFASAAHAAALDPAALIGRTPKQTDAALQRRLIEGRRVLITGAGGSIGSELARRCAASNPALLVLLERSENALFEVDRQLRSLHRGLEIKPILHDVVDAEGTLRRFVAARPDVVFHAAAHKHVPMMEDHPGAAVENNLFGTKSVADAARATGVSRFVLISTDKAVNPSSVMGATKRLAEIYVRSLAAKSEHNTNDPRSIFRIVRFGNVLGSACSVLPIWSAQIAEGGPVTVTHPAMTRFFMTIPEAAGLVIQAAAIKSDDAGDPDLFILDMGEPVRIRDLAERFVRAHGLQPHWEDPAGLADTRPADPAEPLVPNRIRCVFTGIRPGEKLHEELSYGSEELRPTSAAGILAWNGSDRDAPSVEAMISELSAVRNADDPNVVVSILRRHVPGMTHPNTVQIPRVAAA